MWIFATFLGLIIIFGLLLIMRTIRFRVAPMAPIDQSDIVLDEKRIIASLQQMLRFRTVSHIDASKVDKAMFEGFKDYLHNRYPNIREKAQSLAVTDTAILYKINGISATTPVVLMAHYDVVAPNGKWTHDPFSGDVSEGKVHGRGALDTKTTVLGVMESVEHLLGKQHHFANDIYLAFAGDEEIYGKDAASVVDYLKAQGVRPQLVLDEGGAVVQDMFPGVKGKAAMIGIAEKGHMSLELKSVSSGGHAAMPEKSTPVTELAAAVTALNRKNLFKMKLTPSVEKMFDTLGRHSRSFAIRLMFANRWLFLPVVKIIARKSGGEMLSMFKTTQAFTMMQGSEAINVVPSEASIGVNYRLLTGETIDDVVRRIDTRIKPYAVNARVIYGSDPSPVSRTDENFMKVVSAIRETWGDIPSTPYLMMATTDARHYHEISDHVYRFSPLFMTKNDLKTIHGINECVSLDNVLNCVGFYVRLLEKL